MNLNPYRPMTTSGIAHQNDAIATDGIHQAISRHLRGPFVRVSRYSIGTASTAISAEALMPPQKTSARADSAAARRGLLPPPPEADPPSVTPLTSGSRIHGSIAVGRNSEELIATSSCARGASAYAKPASRRALGVPMSSASASLTTPRNAAHSTAATH